MKKNDKIGKPRMRKNKGGIKRKEDEEECEGNRLRN